MKRSVLFFLMGFALNSTAVNAQTLPPGFTVAQWHRLLSVKDYPVLVPSWLPQGYRVAKLSAHNGCARNCGAFGGIDYDIIYSNGRSEILLSGTNGGIGEVESPDPKTLPAPFSSRFLGKGSIKNLIFPDLSTCSGSGWMSYPRRLPSQFGAVMIRSCGPNHTPRPELARMMTSLSLLHH